MIDWPSTLNTAISLASGAGGVQFLTWMRNRRRHEAENRRDDAQADSFIASAAVELLASYKAELPEIKKRLETVETEQQRIVGLFQQSLSVIRDLLAVANRNRWTQLPTISPELQSEIDRAA